MSSKRASEKMSNKCAKYACTQSAQVIIALKERMYEENRRASTQVSRCAREQVRNVSLCGREQVRTLAGAQVSKRVHEHVRKRTCGQTGAVCKHSTRASMCGEW